MIVAIIQARVGSTRLPAKVLADIGGKPMLQRVVERVKRAKRIDTVVVATTTDPTDVPVAALCERLGVPCWRGSIDDVLERYYDAAKAQAADLVVRITADCPLADPQVIDRVVAAFAPASLDYVSNIQPPTYPDGLDVEVMSFVALERAWQNAQLRSEREHVTLYIRNHPEHFRCANIAAPRDLSSLRWTVDEPSDLAFVQSVYAHLGDTLFSMDDVLNLLETHAELGSVNAGIERNEGLIRSLQLDGVQS